MQITRRRKIWRHCIFLLAIICTVCMITGSCKKEDDAANTITDIDGNVYHAVKIGNQVWMVENLKTTRYRNGDPIENITDATAWSTTTEDGYCNYFNKEEYANKFGRLYNWQAMRDSRQIAPAGWHVPSNEEWDALRDELRHKVGTTVAQLLAANSDWKSATEGGAPGFDLEANNATGFAALPAGSRDYSGEFGYIGMMGGWWSSTTILNSTAATCFEMDWNRLELEKVSTLSINGLSIRCIKD